MTGNELRARREEMGLTQWQLSEPLGIAYQNVQKWEAKGDEQTKINSIYWTELARLLAVSVDAFYPVEEVEEEKEALRGMLPVGYVDLERGGFSKIGTKTNSRFVPAHPEAIKIIGQLEEMATNGKKLVFLDDDYITRPRAYLFYRRSMQITLQKAMVNGVIIRQDINFYSFRHTARSAMET